MSIAEIMTRDVATCRTTDSGNRAAQLMWERRCGSVPVVDEVGRVVGIITDRDICMAAYTQGKRLEDIPVVTAMSRQIKRCLPSATIEEAEDLMMAYGIHRLVVVDPEGVLCGLVSIDDIARSGAQWDGKGEIDLERVALASGEIARRNTSPNDDEEPESGPASGDLSALVANSVAALKTLRDEIRVDVNLATKEARDRWRRLEARLRAAETRARNRTGLRNLAELVESAKEFRTRLRDKGTSASPMH
jgi:CBS domain-containing protein